MVNEFLKLIKLAFNYLNLIYNQKIFGKVQNYREKPIYIKLSGSNKNSFIPTLYVRVHTLSGNLLYM
jgi:hypothetical protein